MSELNKHQGWHERSTAGARTGDRQWRPSRLCLDLGSEVLPCSPALAKCATLNLSYLPKIYYYLFQKIVLGIKEYNKYVKDL